MTESAFQNIVIGWIVLGLVLIPVQLLVTAPFGRHSSRRWGPVMDNRIGWVIMELISPVALWASFLWSGAHTSAAAMILMTLWTAHYINRSVIYPMRIRTLGKKIPVLIVVFAICFNAVNGWTNGSYFGSDWGGYSRDWLLDPRFAAGLVVMLCGVAINLKADATLLKLRSRHDTGYEVPWGGLFEHVSCPNFFGEIVEWTGFAIACWNLPALGFAVWTAANLIPRALSHHRWYLENFENYPGKRRAVIPWVL